MENIIRKEDLFNKVLLEPATEADTLNIISGFATPGMYTYHAEELRKIQRSVDVHLIIGMTPFSGISKIYHENFKKIMDENTKFSCSYVMENKYPIHSKVYIWSKDSIPLVSFCGSANYTVNGFKSNQDEILVLCNKDSAKEYYDSIIEKTIYCNHQDADLICKNIKTDYHLQENIDINGISGLQSVELPLFSLQTNKIHPVSGLNWGQRYGRERNQAYIPVPARVARANFFPPRGQYFSVLTDDGFPFVCVVAQDGGKAIETPHNNSQLGEYFRARLGVPSGSFVTLDALDHYGNRYVKFTKIDDEEYLMSFVGK